MLRWSKIEMSLTDQFCTESLWVLPCVLAYQNSNYHELSPQQLKAFEDGVKATRLTRTNLKKQRTANLKPLKDRLKQRLLLYASQSHPSAHIDSHAPMNPQPPQPLQRLLLYASQSHPSAHIDSHAPMNLQPPQPLQRLLLYASQSHPSAHIDSHAPMNPQPPQPLQRLLLYASQSHSSAHIDSHAPTNPQPPQPLQRLLLYASQSHPSAHIDSHAPMNPQPPQPLQRLLLYASQSHPSAHIDSHAPMNPQPPQPLQRLLLYASQSHPSAHIDSHAPMNPQPPQPLCAAGNGSCSMPVSHTQAPTLTPTLPRTRNPHNHCAQQATAPALCQQDKPVAMTPEGDFLCMLDADDRWNNPDRYAALYPTKPAPRKRGATAAGIGAAAPAPKRVTAVGKREKAAAAGATATPGGAAVAAKGGRKAAGTVILSEAKAAAARAQGAAAGGGSGGGGGSAGGSSSKGKGKAGGGNVGGVRVKSEPGSRAEGVEEGDEEYPAEQEVDDAEMAEWEFSQIWTGKRLPKHLAFAAGDKTVAQTLAEEAAGQLADEPEAEYVIERIMDEVLLPSERSGRRVKHFLVKWEGYELNPGTGPEAQDLGESWLTSDQLKGNRMRKAWVKAPPAWWRRQQPGAAAEGPPARTA
ncbi:MAG: hypothetical protein WDW38_000222 [Sanguina aurantia]